MSWLLNRNILLKLGAAAVLLAVFMTVNQAYRISLRDSQFFNGWVLVAVMAGMYAVYHGPSGLKATL